MKFFGLSTLFLMFCVSVSSQTPSAMLAFPGAEGFGKYTSGGRGGEVIIVTNTNDSGPGSLREAVNKKSIRTIVFEVSGTIALESPLKINTGNVTIAGQTAPGDGICLKNYNFAISSDNVIVRYMRFRLGDERDQQADALSGVRNRNIIIDHCSMSWASDECVSVYDNENFTLQYCLITESLNHSVHEKGDHGYGGIWGGMGASFHHNLIAHHKSRLPRFCGARYHKQPDKEIVDFRNNVIFNWMSNNSYGGEEGNHNMVNNYYKPGPSTHSSKDRIVNPSKPYGKFYVSGNIVYGSDKISDDNWAGGVQCEYPDSAKSEIPFKVISIPDQSAESAYDVVLAEAGASFRRDALDKRIIEEVRSGTTTYGKDGIIDSQKDVGGWPILKSEKALADIDRDGMPDVWEKKNKLNCKDPSDANGYTIDKSYTNLEVYLQSILRK